jgi:FADH2-dependent halogenase
VVRSRFDQDLLATAIARGAGRLDATAEDVIRDGDRVCGLRITLPDDHKMELRAQVVVDASGQATFLANRGITGPKGRGNYQRQAGVFSHVTGGIRDEGTAAGDTLIFYRSRHQWAWFIPLTETVTSVGVVVPGECFRSRGQSLDEFLRTEVLAINPELTWRMRDVDWVEPARTASNYSYHVKRFTGPGYLCVGDSHRFIDPIFSFGVFFAMKEASFAASAIWDYFDGKTRGLQNPFADYQQHVERGQQVIQDMIDCFWDFPLVFGRMASQTHRDEIVDCFAGRLYQNDDDQPDAIRTMRRLLAKQRDRAVAA